jgi:polyphosphate kinase 2 (PPK2 family)
MFESAELGHKITKEAYEKEVPTLREKLLDVQYELLEKAPFSVVIIVGGVDGAGKGETVNTLYEWMDPRHITTHAIEAPTPDEQERPLMYRFWQRLPPRGKIGIFLGSWYTDPIIDHTYKRTKSADMDRSMEEIVRFERMLTSERVLVLKFWLHVSKKDQKKRPHQALRRPPHLVASDAHRLGALRHVRPLPPDQRAGAAHHLDRRLALVRDRVVERRVP